MDQTALGRSSKSCYWYALQFSSPEVKFSVAGYALHCEMLQIKLGKFGQTVSTFSFSTLTLEVNVFAVGSNCLPPAVNQMQEFLFVHQGTAEDGDDVENFISDPDLLLIVISAEQYPSPSAWLPAWLQEGEWGFQPCRNACSEFYSQKSQVINIEIGPSWLWSWPDCIHWGISRNGTPFARVCSLAILLQMLYWDCRV